MRVVTSVRESDEGRAAGWRALTVTGRPDGEPMLPLRPMTVGDLLDEPFLLLGAHLRRFLLYVALAVVPSQLLQAYLSRGLLSLDLTELFADPEGFSAVMGAETAASGATGLVSLANALLLMPLAVAAVSRLAVSSALGERLGDRQVLRAVASRLPALAGTWLLCALAVLGMPLLGAALAAVGTPLLGASLVLLGFPAAVVLFVLVAMAPLISVVERRGPLASLRRSVALIRPRFLQSGGTLILALAVSGFVQLALGMIPSLLVFALPERAAWVLASAGSTLASLVTTPYVILVVVVIYLDALVRWEALDVLRLLDRGLARAG